MSAGVGQSMPPERGMALLEIGGGGGGVDDGPGRAKASCGLADGHLGKC